MPNHELSVITYNVHKGFSGMNRRFVLPTMRSALAEAAADVIFLQEVQGEHYRHASRQPAWPKASHFEFLADTLWPHFAYGKNAIYDEGHHGNAILSRHPFESWENVPVSPYNRVTASRSMLHGTLRLPDCDTDLHVVCIHFGFIGRERRSQVRLLGERISEHVPRSAPLIVAGDFNDWTGRAVPLAELGLTEVFEDLNGMLARTFPAWAPMLPMDRIYVRGVEPLAARRLTGSPWSKLSDHTPLQAWFRI
jgi:endonuclease/exonuclease/phosphatase family metal-dependent hydrolase